MAVSNFQAAVKDVAEIFMFEYWLRFYFLREEAGGELYLDVPETEMKRIEAEQPHLAGLAMNLDKCKMDMTTSQENVCAFAGAYLDGARYPVGTVSEVLDSKGFKLAMYVFSLWLKGHEAFLDENPQTFAGFMTHFVQWRDTEEVRRYLEKLDSSGSEPESPANATVH